MKSGADVAPAFCANVAETTPRRQIGVEGGEERAMTEATRMKEGLISEGIPEASEGGRR